MPNNALKLLKIFAATAILTPTTALFAEQPATEAKPFAHGTELSPPRALEAINLRDHHGKPRQLADFQGKWTLLFFGFSSCSTVCPMTLSYLTQELAKIDNWQTQLNVAFITVDTDRDTPERLAKYVANFHQDFLGLYGDKESIEAVARDFGVFFQQIPNAPQGVDDILHSDYLYLLNPDTQWQLLIRTPLPTGALTEMLTEQFLKARRVAILP